MIFGVTYALKSPKVLESSVNLMILITNCVLV